MEHDGRYMLDNNYRCSKDLLDACQAQGTRLLYASSAATYGGSRVVPRGARVRAAAQRLRLLEAAVRQRRAAHAARRAARRSPASATSTSTARASSTRAGWRRSRSTTSTSCATTGQVRLFGDYGGYGAGEQARDFVYVDDVVAVNLWFLEHPEASGIFNLGTGRAQPFNDVARRRRQRRARRARRAGRCRSTSWSRPGTIEYIDFPAALVGKYQCFTEADLGRLRGAGCDHAFADVADRRRALRRLAAAQPAAA